MIKDMLSVDLPLIWNPHTDLSYYNVLQASSSPRLWYQFHTETLSIIDNHSSVRRGGRKDLIANIRTHTLTQTYCSNTHTLKHTVQTHTCGVCTEAIPRVHIGPCWVEYLLNLFQMSHMEAFSLILTLWSKWKLWKMQLTAHVCTHMYTHAHTHAVSTCFPQTWMFYC